MFQWGRVVVKLAVLLWLQSAIAAQRLQCSEERLELVTGISSQMCVFRDVLWPKGVPEPLFQASNATHVAFLDSNMTKIPENFFTNFQRLTVLVVNNVGLQELKIKNNVKIVYAERNRINQCMIDSPNYLTELYLRGNPITSTVNITNLASLKVLDLSGTKIAEANGNTVDFSMFLPMSNLEKLYLSDLEAHYIENEKEVTLPTVKVLDLSNNPIIPSNFHLHIFRGLSNLEELSLLDAAMSDISVSDIRQDFPALKKINIAGNSFKCRLLRALLKHLKENDVEVMDASESKFQKCHLGFDRIENLCCKSDGSVENKTPYPNVTPTVYDTTVSPATETGKVPDPTPKSDGETTPQGGSKSTEGDGSSVTLYVVIAVIVGLLLLAAAGGGIYLKRRSQQTHKAIPKNDPSDNL